MSLPSSVLDAMLAAGCSAEQIVAAVKAANGEEAKRVATRRVLDVSEREWLVLRARVFSRDGFVCAYCGCTSGPHQIDHVHPVSRGGLSVMDNLAVACSPCNASKRDRLVSDWGGRACR